MNIYYIYKWELEAPFTVILGPPLNFRGKDRTSYAFWINGLSKSSVYYLQKKIEIQML